MGLHSMTSVNDPNRGQNFRQSTISEPARLLSYLIQRQLSDALDYLWTSFFTTHSNNHESQHKHNHRQLAIPPQWFREQQLAGLTKLLSCSHHEPSLAPPAWNPPTPR